MYGCEYLIANVVFDMKKTLMLNLPLTIQVVTPTSTLDVHK